MPPEFLLVPHRSQDSQTGFVDRPCKGPVAPDSPETLPAPARVATAWNTHVSASSTGHESYVTFCHLEDEAAFTCSADCTIRKWDVRTGQCLQVFRGHTSIVNRSAWPGTPCPGGAERRGGLPVDVRGGRRERVATEAQDGCPPAACGGPGGGRGRDARLGGPTARHGERHWRPRPLLM